MVPANFAQLEGLKILLLGGAGFIGSNCAVRLSKEYNARVSVADIHSEKPKLLAKNHPIDHHFLDIRTDKAALAQLIRETDVVVNLASIVCPKNYVDDPLAVFDLNIMHGIDIIRECVRQKKRLIHFSISEVYGKMPQVDGTFNETTSDCITGPINKSRWMYSNCKQLLDRVIFGHGQQDGLQFSILRPFNVIGPLYDYHMENVEDGCPRVLAQFGSALINGDAMRIVDGGTSRRCFTDVEDLAKALALIIACPGQSNGHIFNVGSPDNEISIADLATMMTSLFSEITNRPIQSLPQPLHVTGAAFYGLGYEDMPRRVPDITKLRELGWSPQYDLRRTIHRTLEFMIDHHESLTQRQLFGGSYGRELPGILNAARGQDMVRQSPSQMRSAPAMHSAINAFAQQ